MKPSIEGRSMERLRGHPPQLPHDLHQVLDETTVALGLRRKQLGHHEQDPRGDLGPALRLGGRPAKVVRDRARHSMAVQRGRDLPEPSQAVVDAESPLEFPEREVITGAGLWVLVHQPREIQRALEIPRLRPLDQGSVHSLCDLAQPLHGHPEESRHRAIGYPRRVNSDELAAYQLEDG